MDHVTEVRMSMCGSCLLWTIDHHSEFLLPKGIDRNLAPQSAMYIYWKEFTGRSKQQSALFSENN